ncbi:MAG: DUF5667 domain-containing protein [Nocardioidaceae bacterium]
MRPLMPTRRDELADAIDGRGLARHADVRAWVELTEAVRALPEPALRASFLSELRSDLVVASGSELSEREPEHRAHPVAAPAPRWRRLAVAAASALVVAGGGVGVVATSAAALPGELLYPVKRAAERVDLAMHSGDSAAGHILLEHAETRLAEAQELVAANSDSLVAGTLTDFSADATHGGDSLFTAFADSGQTADIETLRAFAASAAASLDSLAPVLPASSYEAYWAAAAAVGALDSAAVRACPSCAGGTPAITLGTFAEDLGPEVIGSGRVPDTSRPGRRTPSTPGAIAPAPPAEASEPEVTSAPLPSTSPDPSGDNGGGDDGGGATAPPDDEQQTIVPEPSSPMPSDPLPSVPLPSVPLPSEPVPSLPLSEGPVPEVAVP